MTGSVFARSDMTTLPMGTSQAATQTNARNGDAVVVRGISAALVVLALVAALTIERPAAYIVSATIVAVAIGLFAAARWRRGDA